MSDNLENKYKKDGAAKLHFKCTLLLKAVVNDTNLKKL